MGLIPCLSLVIVLMIGMSKGDSVSQEEQRVDAEEGEDSAIPCSYSVSSSAASYGLFWYRQYPHRAPQYLLRADSYGFNQTAPGFEHFSGKLNPTQSTFHLSMTDLKMTDSAVYYCALRPTVNEGPAGLIHKLAPFP